MRDDMHCDRCEELLPDLLDGGLPPAPAAALREHLDRCPACRKAFEELAGLERELGRLSGLVPDGAAVAAAVTGRLGLGRRRSLSRTLRRLPIERLALPLGIAALSTATYRFVGGTTARMVEVLTGWLSGIAASAGALAESAPYTVDPFYVYVAVAVLLAACAAVSLSALRHVRR